MSTKDRELRGEQNNTSGATSRKIMIFKGHAYDMLMESEQNVSA